MKILIVYYSRTNNTEKLAKVLQNELEKQNHIVEVEKIKPVKEHSFLYWWHLRLLRDECEIQPPNIKDVSKYDLILVGSPNWTRISLPIVKYLKTIEGLKHKRVALFSTSFFPPAFEWYFLSAYLLDLTFSKIINDKKGRIIDVLLLSNCFKKWSFESNYGKKEIKRFCENITMPILSFKEYYFKKEISENYRFLAVTFSTLFVFILLLRLILNNIFHKGFLTTNQYFLILFVTFFTFLLLTAIRKKSFYFGIYIAVFSSILLWSLFIFFLKPSIYMERLMIFGYILIFIVFGFLRERKTLILSWFFSVVSYSVLFFLLLKKEIFIPFLDLGLISGFFILIYLFSDSLRKYSLSLLEIQDELEIERLTLEIKINARTRELRELAENLDEEVKKRTKELQEKIEELEKFHRLAVDRELKMIELKKEIERLKKYESNSKQKE